jgi:hypothetical protein
MTPMIYIKILYSMIIQIEKQNHSKTKNFRKLRKPLERHGSKMPICSVQFIEI